MGVQIPHGKGNYKGEGRPIVKYSKTPLPHHFSPPSWICGEHFGTAREEYWEIFIIAWNLVGIAAVVLIVRIFEYFALLVWKHLFMLPKWVFGVLDRVNGEHYQLYPRRHILVQKHITWCIDHHNRSNGCWDIPIYHFFKVAAVRRFELVGHILGPPEKSTWGTYQCAKFVQNLVVESLQ